MSVEIVYFILFFSSFHQFYLRVNLESSSCFLARNRTCFPFKNETIFLLCFAGQIFLKSPVAAASDKRAGLPETARGSGLVIWNHNSTESWKTKSESWKWAIFSSISLNFVKTHHLLIKCIMFKFTCHIYGCNKNKIK